jgi:hypothetical protein
MQDELGRLRDELYASCEGFNRKNIEAWLGPFHDDAVTFSQGFVPISATRPMAESIIGAAKSFDVDNVDGRIVGTRPSFRGTTDMSLPTAPSTPEPSP